MHGPLGELGTNPEVGVAEPGSAARSGFVAGQVSHGVEGVIQAAALIASTVVKQVVQLVDLLDLVNALLEDFFQSNLEGAGGAAGGGQLLNPVGVDAHGVVHVGQDGGGLQNFFVHTGVVAELLRQVTASHLVSVAADDPGVAGADADAGGADVAVEQGNVALVVFAQDAIFLVNQGLDEDLAAVVQGALVLNDEDAFLNHGSNQALENVVLNELIVGADDTEHLVSVAADNGELVFDLDGLVQGVDREDWALADGPIKVVFESEDSHGRLVVWNRSGAASPAHKHSMGHPGGFCKRKSGFFDWIFGPCAQTPCAAGDVGIVKISRGYRPMLFTGTSAIMKRSRRAQTMKPEKRLEELMLVLNQQTLLAEAAKAKAEEAKAELLALMLEDGEKKVATDNGVAVLVETRKFDLAGFPEVAQAKALLDQVKKDAEGTAPFTVQETLRFTPNRGKEVPKVKTPKAWKTRVVVTQGTAH